MTSLLRDPVALFSTGPVAAYPAVLRAMARPVLYDHDPQFQTLYEAVTRKAAAVLRWPHPALILQCEAAPGLEAAAASLIAPGDVVLNLVSGLYGAGFATWARRYAAEVVDVAVPFDEAIDPAAVARALRLRPETRVVSVVHHETPSGTLNPVREIGRVVRDHGALLLVDAVSSFGGMDIHPADCHADIFVTGPGKCLGGTPGLTLMAVSEAAWAAIAANPAAPRGSVLSLADWRDSWRADQAFPFTPSVAEIYGLDAALDLYLAEGPQSVWARHDSTARACRAGAQALGLALWPARGAIASPTATALRLPDGLSPGGVIAAARRLGIVFPITRGASHTQALRIGHMGPMAEPILATLAVTALAAALRAAGFACDAGVAVEAALGAIA